jgi:hypothetical protein
MIANRLSPGLLKIIIDKLNVEGMRQIRRRRDARRQALAGAVGRAYAVWAPQNWEWVDSLFNEHFLAHRAVPVLTRYLDDSRQSAVVELANAWAEQLSWFDVELKRRHIANLTPVAAHFLRCLDAELGIYSTCRPGFEPGAKEAGIEVSSQTV